MFLLIFNEGNVIKGEKLTHVLLRQVPFIEIKILSQFIYLGKFGFFEECGTKYFALNLQLFFCKN